MRSARQSTSTCQRRLVRSEQSHCRQKNRLPTRRNRSRRARSPEGSSSIPQDQRAFSRMQKRVSIVFISLTVFITAAFCANVALGQSAPTGVHFTDITQQAGIRFVHNNGAFGKKYLPETLGPGCAFIDYDNDGYPDIIMVNGEDWPGHPKDGQDHAQAVSQQPQRNIHRRHCKGWTRDQPLRSRGHSRRLRQRRIRRPFHHRARAESPVSQQSQWHVHGCDEAGRLMGSE